MTREEVQEALEQLERDGLVRRNGVMRPDRDGNPRPVYVTTELGREMHQRLCALPGGLAETAESD